MTRLGRFVDSCFFQNFVLAVIVLAAILIGLETSRDLVADYGAILHTLDTVVLWIFVAEAALKIARYGRHGYRYFADPWNLFDFTIVVVCFLPVGGQYAAVLRLARVLRALRLVSAVVLGHYTQEKDSTMPTRTVPVPAILAMVIACAAVCHAADYTVHVVEPAVTDHLILPDGPLPAVCRLKTSISLSGCRGEYEPASFVVTSSKPLDRVRIEVDPLAGEGGQGPREAVDVRVVKSYYGRSSAGPQAPIPALLVHDDDFLAIEPDPTPENPERMKNVTRGPLRDAPKLQPVAIEKRRQFWITVRIPDRADAGTYRTTLRIVPANSEPVSLELGVEVHPFELRDSMLEYSMYYPVMLVPDGAQDWRTGQWSNVARLTRQQYIAECRNMLAHGLSNPNIYGGVSVRPDGTLDTSQLEQILQAREEAGMGPGVPLYTMTSAAEPVRWALTDQEKAQRIQTVRDVMTWARRRGYPDFYWAGQDEAWGEWLASERDSFQAIHDGGGKTFVACGSDFFKIIGDVLDLPVMYVNISDPMTLFGAEQGFGPDESLRQNHRLASLIGFERQVDHPTYRRSIDGLHRLGRKIFTYTTLRPPMPQWHRRHGGLGLWRIGFDGVMNWAYTHISADPENQPMHFAMVLRTEGGVLDTPKWEGFREGVDDVRYLTTLLATLAEALGRFPDEPLIAETHQWVGKLDVAQGDLDTMRQEMARRIVALQRLGHRDLTPAEALAGIDVERVEMVTLADHWRFRLVEIDQSTMMKTDAFAQDDGLRGKWFDPARDDSHGAPGLVGGGYELGAGGGWGNEPGFGWYRTRLALTVSQRAGKFKYLHFDACDEDAWIYLNGKRIFEHTVESTGLMGSEIWRTPFVVPLNDVALNGDDALVVRIRNTEGMGGIWKPVRLIVSDQLMDERQVKALVTVRNRFPDTIHE
ncbi:MAG: ion transporter [Candidatus Latescibacterota bacterium]|nr:ion transporter [Candidatus Latescibacterota bacterium]